MLSSRKSAGDGESDVAFKPALPALVDADLLAAFVAKFVPTSIMTVHSTAIALPPIRTMVMN